MAIRKRESGHIPRDWETGRSAGTRKPFPLLIDLEGEPCLVVGSGDVATRKAAALADFGAHVTTVSPEVCGRGFDERDVAGMRLVVAATDDRAVNARVAAACRVQGVPVNVVDDPALCTFVFPAIARKGPMLVAVSSGGACPTAAQLLRDKAARLMTDEFVEAVERLGRDREKLKGECPDPQERKRKCEEALARWRD